MFEHHDDDDFPEVSYDAIVRMKREELPPDFDPNIKERCVYMLHYETRTNKNNASHPHAKLLSLSLSLTLSRSPSLSLPLSSFLLSPSSSSSTLLMNLYQPLSPSAHLPRLTDLPPPRADTRAAYILIRYLSDADFGAILGMEKRAFYELPRWQQIQLKIENKLF